jgi:3',5'-cyclic AMP phosphodiesterase CpdA
MRSVVLSAALEFNYLRASIGFLVLIVGPALLVGIVPSVAVSYGRLKFHAATLAGSRPIVALVLLALMVAAALKFGRPLVARAIDNFWHLHYTLVLPMFVTLREFLRYAAERFPSRALTPQEVHRRRQSGTVLAAVLLVFGGIALAMTVEFSTGFHLVDFERIRPWAAARAALGNAAVVLGLSTAAESLYWLVRELSFNSQVFDWAPGRPTPQMSTARVAHLSDLHVVGERYGYRMEAGTHGPRGNRCIRTALRRLAAIHAASPVDRVLVTGDITDAGLRSEWAEFLDLLRSHPELRARLSFVPGNHDVNIVDRTNPGRPDLPWSTGQSLRKLRVVLALDAIQGDRSYLVDRKSGAPGPSLKDYLREGERAERLRALAERGTVRGRFEMAKVWDAVFPLVEPAGIHGYGVILLNSNARSHFSLTNAIGVVSRSQLSALRSILNHSPGRPWVILLHHQVVEYPLASISLSDRIGLALVNAPDVLAAIAPHASRVLVLHGHRHRDWVGICSEVVLCSAPSAALRSDGGEHPGSFHVHQLAFGTDGGVQLSGTERVWAGHPGR